MSKKNKFYWFEGVTEKGVNALLSDENPKFRWLRPQRNRRVLVVLMAVGLVLTALGSYRPALKSDFGSSGVASVIFIVLGGYSLLRISVRSIADAPDELLDERQVVVRNTSYRYAYYAMGYLLLGLLLLMFFGPQLQMFESEGNDGSFLMIASLFAYSSLPSMVMAWRERDI